MKKIVGTVLAAAIMISQNQALANFKVYAQDITIAAPVESAVRQADLSAMITVEETGENYIIGTNAEGLKFQFNISEDTVIIDSAAKSAASVSDIEKGGIVYAQYSPIMTKSLPPQTNASLIALNTQEGGGVELLTADEIIKSEDSKYSVYDKAKQIIVTIGEKAQVKPLRTKQIIKAEDITEGSKVLMWYDQVGLSLPGKAYTETVILVSQGKDAYEVEIKGEKVSVENSLFDESETLMVPLREISEKLGYKVEWDNEAFCAKVSSDKGAVKVYVGDKKYCMASSDLSSFGQLSLKTEPQLKDDVTYVPVDVFKSLGGNDAYKLDGKTLSFNS